MKNRVFLFVTVHEVPFSSESKFQHSVHHLESGSKPSVFTFKTESKSSEDLNVDKMLLVMKGAPEKILERCSTVRLGDNDVPVRG